MADFRRSDYDPFLWFQGFVVNSSVYDRFGNQNTFEAKILTVVTTGEQKRFFVRITDERMAHETFLSDPCNLTNSTADPNAQAALTYGLHSEMIVNDTEIPQSLSSGDKIIVRCVSGLNGDKFDLRKVYFVSIIEKNANNENDGVIRCPPPISNANFNAGSAVSSFNYDLLRSPEFPEPDVLQEVLATQGNVPEADKVIAAIQSHGWPLPEEGRAYIVAIIQRNANPPSPFNDWVGILRNQDGEFYWRAAVGTGEPGYEAMTKQTSLSRRANYNMGRVVVPSFNENSHGGGYHQWKPSQPAFRQAGLIQMEQFSPANEGGSWSRFTARGPDYGGRNANHNHTTRGGSYSSVGDWSHGCIVALDPAEHEKNLRLAGWEPEAPPGGTIRHTLVALDISEVQ